METKPDGGSRVVPNERPNGLLTPKDGSRINVETFLGWILRTLEFCVRRVRYFSSGGRITFRTHNF